jgi:GT2 family glycosyltransferase
LKKVGKKETMKLTVVIVNYNVEHFLEQCLLSVRQASQNVATEVYVVDNISIDGSVEMVKEKFPEVILIENKQNVGFSKANNQAIRVSKGEYVLLLNPDTVVEEDTFEKVVAFMDEHKDAGGLGVKMIDGKGVFLPESKRGLPTPNVAFYKIFGLSNLFPKSKKFGRYHLGYLDKDEVNEIEVLSGAFMLMRRKTLDKVGLLDEDFFMYGEDIDLSYRIILGGYKNYYYPKTKIIHYKGESTKKSSVNYVFVFYNAMIIFAKKHFSSSHANTFSFLIKIAIYFRASIAILNRIVKKLSLPLFDYALSVALLFVVAYFYQEVKPVELKQSLLNIALPIYGLVWLLAMFFMGGYDKPVKLLKILKGGVVGTAVILMVYGLLPKTVQFSRLIIIVGFLTTVFAYIGTRGLLHLFKVKGFDLSAETKKRFVIVGSVEETERVKTILEQTSNIGYLANISPTNQNQDAQYDGIINQLEDFIHINKINEVIFCAKDMTAQQIIHQMSNVSVEENVDFKIAQPNSLFLIGSNSIHTSGDIYLLDLNNITKPENVRNKRVFDMLVSAFLFVLFPVVMLIQRKPIGFVLNCFQVFVGKRTWVGFNVTGEDLKLPKIKEGVLKITTREKEQSPERLYKLNMIYAKDYNVSTDLKIVLGNLRFLGG